VKDADSANQLQHDHFEHRQMSHTTPHSHLQGLDHLKNLEPPDNLMFVVHLGNCKENFHKCVECAKMALLNGESKLMKHACISALLRHDGQQAQQASSPILD
jgi:hypothetical protein